MLITIIERLSIHQGYIQMHAWCSYTVAIYSSIAFNIGNYPICISLSLYEMTIHNIRSLSF